MEKLCMLVMVIAISASIGNAQDTSCLKPLVSCLQYLNSTSTPSSTCCDPLKSVVKTDPICLCNLITSPAASQAGINVTQAAQLPQRCGENVSASTCSSIVKTATSQPSSAYMTCASKMMTVVAFAAATIHIVSSL